ncbi:hypothetical protein Q8W71_18715 [Methylobacterium sp. NEAU 140]|uniref:hypothetical protein n=1 Tax=Methylobacterium sp. NEAU 140 TaxID=3064945 RepID=UPI0027325123|nr:hypothetical protein [Methylobacterium sp. NEAU 140]MDP4024663.1 hypothetical protein [Methylobacterium sp. NEAU 140]
MERLLIILAVLIGVAAGVSVIAMRARSQRPPLRMDHDVDEADEPLVLGRIGAPASPIDRSAEILDARVVEREISEPLRRLEQRRQAGGSPPDPARPDPGAEGGR